MKGWRARLTPNLKFLKGQKVVLSFTLPPDDLQRRPEAWWDNRKLDQRTAILLAGARARGISDAFDLLCLNVVLLDEAGMVLHINQGARQLLGSEIYLVEDHLIIQNQIDNSKLLSIVHGVLAGSKRGEEINIATKSGGLKLRILPLPEAMRDPGQLLHALVCLIPFYPIAG